MRSPNATFLAGALATVFPSFPATACRQFAPGKLKLAVAARSRADQSVGNKLMRDRNELLRHRNRDVSCEWVATGSVTRGFVIPACYVGSRSP